MWSLPGPARPELDGAEGAALPATRPLPEAGLPAEAEPLPEAELLPAPPPGAEPPAEILRRAVALVEYLLAVRALMEKPARTVPGTDAFWHADLPAHPACELGPGEPAQPSWLRVGRPPLPPAPQIPTGLVHHLVWDLSPRSSPTLVADAETPLPEPVRAEFLDWYERQWQPWAREFTAAEATRTVHDRLYDLRYRQDIDSARSELVWGHLVLDTEVAGERVHYPLLATPVAIGYDPETSTVTVTPEGPPRLQPDALAGLDDRRLADLLALGGAGGQVGLDLWDPVARRGFAERALRRLGFDPLISSEQLPGSAPEPARPDQAGLGPTELDPAAAPGRPYLRDTGVLFLRPRQRMVRRFLERMRERLLEGDPAAVGALASILAHEPSRLAMPGDDPPQWQRTGERLLMPMATNDAQESIARRLAAHRSVAVQGPPGTGKTHTIRNLICHLVAHGKRVLVLAQKEDPLRVLRDGLPEELRPLCLAILGRSSDQLGQLQIAARELSDRAATLDQPAEAARVRSLADQLGQAEQELAQAQEQLRAAAERESATYPLAEADATASEVGRWLRQHEAADGFIPDPVDPGTGPPLPAAEFAELSELAAGIPAADRAAATGRLPAEGSLPTGEQVAAGRDALRDAGKVIAALRDRGLVIDEVRELGQERVDELAAGLRGAADDLTRRQGSWTDRLGRLVQDPNWQRVWDHHVAACRQLLTELAARTAYLAGREVQLGEAAGQPRQLLRQLAELRARFAAGKRVGRLARAELARLAGDCLVDGEPLRSTTDVDMAVATVEREQLRRELANRWAEWGERLEVPAPAGPAELWAGQLLAEAADALDWERRRWPAMHATLARIYPGCPRAIDARQAGELAGAVEAGGNVFLADRLRAEQEALAAQLRELVADPAASPVGKDLLAAWQAGDLPAWDAARAEVARLWRLREPALRYAGLRERLAAVAPVWAGRVDSGQLLPGDGPAALRAWQWRQAQTWFDEVVGGVDLALLGRRIEACRDRARRLTHELVVGSAWLEVSLTLDDRRKAALADWTAALRKIGKGTGKTAPHWQAAAQQAMAEAATAVPVWIMSIDRALEQFRGGDPGFDVVVVDEASQADIFALPVLSLARRAVVVGDDQQIGPQLVGTPTDRVQALIRTHLAGVPSAVHFDTESSLYDHAVRRSPQRILLTEHFRCVPPIIAFSSQTYYDGQIQPLRADRPVGLGEPVLAVPVADGCRTQLPEYGQVNVPEAEALVARVAGIVADPAYRGRSIGVMSLLSGSGQAGYLLHRLREVIGADELERRALRVGDPYTFQGDERDVVLISMVVAADREIGAFTKRDFHRRVNVAASRARDQLWLFHSVQPADLPAGDARALLLSHYGQAADAGRAGGPPEPGYETEFQRAVGLRLAEHGLAPAVRYRIGDYRIDFVVTAPDGRRLAIECDGDWYAGAEAFARDLHRQAVLERVGNCVFVRLRASTFARDPDQAMAAVWERAGELSIPLAEQPAARPG